MSNARLNRATLSGPLDGMVAAGERFLALARASGSSPLVLDAERIRDAALRLRALVYGAPASSHDLHTPLNHLLGYSDLLLEEGAENLPVGGVRELEQIRAAAREALTVIQAARAPAARDSAGPAPRPTPAEEAGSFLVVDDDATNRDLLDRHLRRRGHQVLLAETGRRALDLLAAARVDVILLDLLMPELDGYETLKHLKADPDLHDIPVIVMSALDEIDSVVRCLEAGAEDYLHKPFNPVLLDARLGASLGRKRLRDHEVLALQNRVFQRMAREREKNAELERALAAIEQILADRRRPGAADR